MLLVIEPCGGRDCNWRLNVFYTNDRENVCALWYAGCGGRGAEGAERSVNCKIVPNEVVRGQLRPGAGESGRRDCSGDKGRLSRRPVDLADRLQQVTVSGC